MELTTIFSGIKTAESLLGKVLSKKGTRLQKKIEAVSLMQRAINSTEIYLTNSNHTYQPNEDLSEQWLVAFTAMLSIDKKLANRLRAKSKFWTNPQRWLLEENTMELVPDLNELDQKCEMLIIELEKRF